MTLSDWQIRQLDEQYTREPIRNPCPVCGAELIIARGRAGEPMEVFKEPICLNCQK